MARCWLLAPVLCACLLASAAGEPAAEMTCRSCPEGLFLNQTSLACAACPANSRVPAAGNASSALACACEAGYANGPAVCAPCALGRYKGALGNVTCSACPVNTNTTAVARVALEECLCAPGFFLDASVWLPCAAGSFKGHVGNEACAACSDDTYCPAQSIAPVPCVGNSSRLQVGGQTVRDCLCHPGFFTEDDVTRTCRGCPVGTFNAAFHQTSCTACPAGTVNTKQAAADAAACIACGANAAGPAGSNDATACACNLGYSGEPGGVCVACAAGKFRSNAFEYICQACPADTYNAELSVDRIESCIACPANTSTTNHTGSGNPLDCVCPPGFRTAANDAGARQCAQCGAGNFQPADNATACLACDAGTYSAAPAAVSAASCVGCAPGSFAAGVGSGHCELCAADAWQDLRRSDFALRPCEACPGNSSNVRAGAFNVSACVCAAGWRLAGGSFAPDGTEDADAYGCVPCDACNYCPGNGSSLTCPLNTWAAARVNAGPCEDCAQHSFALAAVAMSHAGLCQCGAGAEGAADRNCSLCAAGLFQPCDFSAGRAHAAEHIATCEARALAIDTADATDGAAARPTRCEACPANFYSDAAGAANCTACPANASSAAGSDSLLRCRCDAAFTGVDGGACATCPADSFCNGDLTHPYRLYSTSPADSDSADDCVCRADFFSRNATSHCLKCPENTYCPGSQTVNLCAFNSSSPVGSQVIEQCLCGPGKWRGCVDGRNAEGDCEVDWSVGCFECDAGDICANRTLLQCPEHRSSQPGSDEGADCACNGGYFNVATHEHTHGELANHTHR